MQLKIAMKFNSRVIVILVVLIGFAIGFFYQNSKSIDLESNKVETVGKLYRIRNVHSSFGKKIYEYEFQYNDKEYTGETRARLSDSIRVGEFYKVELSVHNPENNKMDFNTSYEKIIRSDANGIAIDTTFKIRKTIPNF